VVTLCGRWRLIDGEARIDDLERLTNVASRLVPAYMHDLCQRRLRFAETGQPQASFIEQLIEDVADFVDRKDGNPKDVLSALDVLTPDNRDASKPTVAEIFGRLIWEGKLLVAERSNDPRQAVLAPVPGQRDFTISYAHVNRVLQDVSKVAPSMDCVLAGLRSADAIIEKRHLDLVLSGPWIEACRQQAGGEVLTVSS
jgi:hypothetical protein